MDSRLNLVFHPKQWGSSEKVLRVKEYSIMPRVYSYQNYANAFILWIDELASTDILSFNFVTGEYSSFYFC